MLTTAYFNVPPCIFCVLLGAMVWIHGILNDTLWSRVCFFKLYFEIWSTYSIYMFVLRIKKHQIKIWMINLPVTSEQGWASIQNLCFLLMFHLNQSFWVYPRQLVLQHSKSNSLCDWTVPVLSLGFLVLGLVVIQE